jgi:cell division septum initiation protein DivIVA
MDQSIPEIHDSSPHAEAGRTDLPISETELGRLFVEAQRFTDDALAKLDSQVDRVLAQASAKAAQIVLEAREEAEQILRTARDTVALPTETAGELRVAVDQLSKFVGELATMLKTDRPSSGATGTDGSSK